VPSGVVDCSSGGQATFRAHLTDPVGIVGGPLAPDDDTGTSVSSLLVTNGPPGGYQVTGHLVSGTTRDGDWVFGDFCQFQDYTTWKVGAIYLLSASGATLRTTADAQGFRTTFHTTGTYGTFTTLTPAPWVATTLAPDQDLTLHGRVTAHVLGAAPPVPGLVVQIRPDPASDADATEVQDLPVLATMTTAADGSWSYTWRPSEPYWRVYVTWAAGTMADGTRYTDGFSWTGAVRLTG
jgi:hypothetical protein